MNSPFQVAAPALRANGYSVIPLAAGQKYPTIERWSDLCLRMPTEEEHDQWMRWKSCNVGVCLGPASGVMALDFDDDVDGLHGKIMALIPASPVTKRGSKGHTAFYRFTGQKSAGFSVNGVRVLDVLSSGRQTVLPNSLHPGGKPYQWLSDLTLADVAPSDLPEIPALALSRIAQLFRVPEPTQPIHLRQPYNEATADDIEEALAYIPADDYDTWLRVGMALKEHLGEPAFSVWDKWSATSGNYDSKLMPGKWKSFRRTDVTIASLFYMAMDRGYVRACAPVEAGQRVTIIDGGNLRPHKRTAAEADILNPPGLVGRVAAWINETAIYPQPTLSVAAAITCVGAAMAHKVQSPTRLRTNFYTLGLAPSGAGKDHARKCVVNLLRYSGLDGVLGGEPASGAGLLTAIREGQGRCLIQWDEFGRVLKMLSGKNASSHQSDVLRMLVELFSSASSVFEGVQYANHDGNMKRKPIDQPCLSVYGTTVPENFYNSITHSDAIDGFLARFLVMESREYTLQGRKVTLDINDPPEPLLEELRRWKDAPSNYDPKGNIDGVIRICPTVVSYTDEAEIMMAEYTVKMRKKVIEENERRSGLSAIYARSAEHAIKLALVAHEGDSIDVEAMRWGIAVADWSTRYLADAVIANVADNEFERTAKKVLAIIGEAKGDWMPHSALVKRTQGLSARVRGEVLENLLEGGLIDIEKQKVEGTHKPAAQYRRK